MLEINWDKLVEHAKRNGISERELYKAMSVDWQKVLREVAVISTSRS